MPAPAIPDAAPLYAALNAEFFDDALPPCQIRWSRRLTRTAGNIRVQTRVISLSIPLLIDAFASGDTFNICGVPCADADAALREILKHEMIHLWLHERALPSGHTAAFRAKARQIGQPKTRHGISLPLPKSGWVYSCRNCGAQLQRQRELKRVAACAKCCREFNKGKFDARFLLVEQKIDRLLDC